MEVCDNLLNRVVCTQAGSLSNRKSSFITRTESF